jgi:uncharacterized protein (TIGR03083 family)
MLLSEEELVAWVTEAGEVIAEAATESGPDAPIPACEGWTMADLLGHVAPFCSGWYSYNLTHEPGEGDIAAAMASAPEMPGDHAGRVAYLREACAGFTALAGSVDLDAPVWAFWMTRPARFWLLRAATEVAVHAWDAQSAVGTPAPLEPHRAATSIDETLRGMWPGLVELGRRGILLDQPPELPMEPVGVAATDSGHSWVMSHIDGDIQVTEAVELPPTVVSGRGHDLVLYQWGRPVDTPIQISGAGEVADAWNVCCAASVAQQQATERQG